MAIEVFTVNLLGFRLVHICAAYMSDLVGDSSRLHGNSHQDRRMSYMYALVEAKGVRSQDQSCQKLLVASL